MVRPTSPRAAQRTAVRNRAQQQLRSHIRARAALSAVDDATAVVAGSSWSGRPPATPSGSVVSSSSTTYRRFVRFARRPVVTRARLSPFWRSVAATSHTFSRRSDRWIGDFFTPSQSRFAGPTSSACISSTVAPFGVLLVPVRS
ncbi:proline-rich receptor-like protein kinase PERK12 [Iris pallida]|uniref:Proline-rich receptor-like protein kinase PERK12 n=1 Tax=Iris pallida TaxID=29817 RepID=A0AAX6G760_IRIPA|nr:proline-rich receptor-like protein kinase PERK12 [Iris pallida]